MRRAFVARLCGLFIPFRRNRRHYFTLIGALFIGYIFLSKDVFLFFWQTITILKEQSLGDNPHMYRRGLIFSETWAEVEGFRWTRNDLPNDNDPELSRSTKESVYQVHNAFAIASVHMVWCGRNRQLAKNNNRTTGTFIKDPGIFRFENLLALSSALKILKPLRLVVHYRESPRADRLRYHTWWDELKQSVPTLVLRPAGSELDLACENSGRTSSTSSSFFSSFFDTTLSMLPATMRIFSASQRAFLTFILRQLAREEGGGAWVGDSTLLSRLPQEMTYSSPPFGADEYPKEKGDNFFYYISDGEGVGKAGEDVSDLLEIPIDVSQGVIVTRTGFSGETIKRKLFHVLNTALASHTASRCAAYNSRKRNNNCPQNMSLSTMQHQCQTVKEYNYQKELSSPEVSALSSSLTPCLVLRHSIYPHNIWRDNTRLSELARWLYYGERRQREVKAESTFASASSSASSSFASSSETFELSSQPPSFSSSSSSSSSSSATTATTAVASSFSSSSSSISSPQLSSISLSTTTSELNPSSPKVHLIASSPSSSSLSLSQPPLPLPMPLPSPSFRSPTSKLIPRVHHMVWTKSNLPWSDRGRFTFIHYLSALSALYVAGASTLLVHGEVEPWGEWWDLLLKQNSGIADRAGEESRKLSINSVEKNAPERDVDRVPRQRRGIRLSHKESFTKPHVDSLHLNMTGSPEISKSLSSDVVSTHKARKLGSLQTSASTRMSQHESDIEGDSTDPIIPDDLIEKRSKSRASVRRKKVVFVKTAPDPLESIFQQEVILPAHRSDIMRVMILLKHGGVYQDRDVIWTGRIPTALRRYPAVVCNDWPRYGEWPASFNIGVFLAQPGAEYLKRLLETFRYYRDDDWSYNAILMPYKVYERNPELLYVDKYLQTICFMGTCHPTWHSDYIRPLEDTRQIDDFRWWQTRSVHFTFPKTPASLVSPKAARSGTDVAAKVARMVLKVSGQSYLLDSDS